MTVSGAVSRCRCTAVTFFVLVVVSLMILCSSCVFEVSLFVVAPSGSFSLSLHLSFLRVCRCTVGFFMVFRHVVASFVGRRVVGFFSFAGTPLVYLCSCRFDRELVFGSIFVILGDEALSIFSFVDNACDEGGSQSGL